MPYLAVHDAAAALDWYTDALDGVETVRYVGDDGRIGHAEITIQGANIMLSDAYPEIGVVAANSYEGSSCALHLEVTDIDAVHAAAVESRRDVAARSGGSAARLTDVDGARSVRTSLDVQPDDRHPHRRRDRGRR